MLTETKGTTWFEKIKDGDGHAAHLLLHEHYVGEAHDMRRAALANSKLENLFCKSKASFSFEEKFLTCMNKVFQELKDAGQPLYPSQKVQWLLRGVKNDDIQVQATMGIIHDQFLTDFDSAYPTLSCAVSTQFTNIKPTATNGVSARYSRAVDRAAAVVVVAIGTVDMVFSANHMKVNVTDISRNFKTEEWDKLRAVGGTYVYMDISKNECLSGRGNRDDRGS